MARLHQTAADYLYIAGDLDGALARSREAMRLGRVLAANWVFWESAILAAGRYEQQEPFAALLTLAHDIADEEPARAAALSEEAFRVAQESVFSRAGRAATQRDVIETDASKLVRMVMAGLPQPSRLGNEIAAGAYGQPGDDLRVKAEAIRAETLANLRQAVALLKSEKVDPTAILLPRTIGVDEARASLQDDEAIVVLAPGSSLEIHALVLTRRDFVWKIVSDDLTATEEAITLLRSGIGVTGARGAVSIATAQSAAEPGTLIATAWELYNDLLKPLEPALSGASHIMVLTGGELAKFPFEMLVTEQPNAGTTFASARWLVRDRALTVLPALSVLATRGETQSPPSGPVSLLAFGDPDYAAAGADARLPSEVRALASLASLPESSGEVRQIAAAMGATDDDIALGRDAVESRLFGVSADEKLARYDVLLFATHGLQPSDIDGLYEPALALTPVASELKPLYLSGDPSPFRPDGLLTTSEIVKLRLGASLVILSACNSAADSPIDPEAYSGLASAFLSAGANSVLASHWPVQSDAAVAITTGMMRRLATARSTMRRADAFRLSVLDVIDNGHADPRYWAPFSLYGRV